MAERSFPTIASQATRSTPASKSGNTPAAEMLRAAIPFPAAQFFPQREKAAGPTLQTEVTVLAMPRPPCLQRHDQRGGEQQVQREAARLIFIGVLVSPSA